MKSLLHHTATVFLLVSLLPFHGCHAVATGNKICRIRRQTFLSEYAYSPTYCVRHIGNICYTLPSILHLHFINRCCSRRLCDGVSGPRWDVHTRHNTGGSLGHICHDRLLIVVFFSKVNRCRSPDRTARSIVEWTVVCRIASHFCFAQKLCLCVGAARCTPFRWMCDSIDSLFCRYIFFLFSFFSSFLHYWFCIKMCANGVRNAVDTWWMQLMALVLNLIEWALTWPNGCKDMHGRYG